MFFPKQLTFIGKAAFYGCSSLEMVKLNANVKEIAFRAFNVCPFLMTIRCDIKNVNKTKIDPKAFDTYAFQLCKLVVSNLKLYKKHDIFGKFEHIELDTPIKNATKANDEKNTKAKITAPTKVIEIRKVPLDDNPMPEEGIIGIPEKHVTASQTAV